MAKSITGVVSSDKADKTIVVVTRERFSLGTAG